MCARAHVDAGMREVRLEVDYILVLLRIPDLQTGPVPACKLAGGVVATLTVRLEAEVRMPQLLPHGEVGSSLSQLVGGSKSRKFS